jgi:hypothetical protein
MRRSKTSCALREGDEGGGDDGDRPAPHGGPRWRSRNEPIDFRGERRLKDTHCSATDPEARFYWNSSGTGSLLSHSMHTLTENRLGFVLVVGAAEQSVSVSALAADMGTTRATSSRRSSANGCGRMSRFARVRTAGRAAKARRGAERTPVSGASASG